MKSWPAALFAALAGACVHHASAPPARSGLVSSAAVPTLQRSAERSEQGRGEALTCDRALDGDCDGIDDLRDHCPREAEDCDGFEDDDGCPELDNDGDMIADSCDRCPGVPEDFNGIEDDDGCPEGTQGYDGRELRVPSSISFSRGSAALEGEQRALLEEVATSVQDTPALTRLACVGTRTSDEPQTLALARARAVCSALQVAGVDAERLSLATSALAEEREPPVPPRAVYFETLETLEVRLREVREGRVRALPGGAVVLQPRGARGARVHCPGGQPVPQPVANPGCTRGRSR